MIRLQDIHSLSDFQRNTKEHLKRLEKTGRAAVLTVNGEARLVVQDAASYQRLLDAAIRIGAIEDLREPLAEVKAGGGRAFAEVVAELNKKYFDPSGRVRSVFRRKGVNRISTPKRKSA